MEIWTILTFYLPLRVLLDTTNLCPRDMVVTVLPVNFLLVLPSYFVCLLLPAPCRDCPIWLFLNYLIWSVSVLCRKFSHNAGTARLLPLAVYFKPFISRRCTFFTTPGLQPNLELGTTNGQSAKFQSPQTAFILVSKVMFSLHPSLSCPIFVSSTSSLHESLHFICVLADFTAML